MSDLSDSDVERALLGCVIQDPTAHARTSSQLAPEDFSVLAHARIWAAMQALRARTMPADHLVLSEELRRRGDLGTVGGPGYLMQLDQAAPVTSHADSYVEIVRDRSRRRTMAKIARDLARAAGDPRQPLEDVVGRTQSELAKAGAGAYRVRSLGEINRGVWQRMIAVQEGQVDPVLPTGFRAWDNLVGGLQPSLTVIGGRTGGGKSALAAAFIQNLAVNGHTIGLFSLEDAGEWLTYRYLAALSGVPNFVIRFRKKTDAEWEKIGRVSSALYSYEDRILVDDTPNLSSREIIARAEDLVVNRKASAIFVDHLQEIDHSIHKEDRHELKVRESLSDLRSFANRYQVPVVLLAQAREGGEAEKKRPPPTIADFQDAPGAIAKISRVAAIAELDAEAGELAVHLLKHTNGFKHKTARFKFIAGAGLAAELPQSEQLELHRTMAAEFEPMKTPEPTAAAVPAVAAAQAQLRLVRGGFVEAPEEREEDEPWPE